MVRFKIFKGHVYKATKVKIKTKKSAHSYAGETHRHAIIGKEAGGFRVYKRIV